MADKVGEPDKMPGQPTLRYRILRKIALDDADGRMVFLTAVIALTGLVGIILVILGGRDTSRLVTAAEKQAAAARKSADAAKSFADTAEQISKGISEAVDKLKVQASANQNLASAAKIANANTLEADRPWIGVFLQVSDFALGKTPTTPLYSRTVGSALRESRLLKRCQFPTTMGQIRCISPLRRRRARHLLSLAKLARPPGKMAVQ